MDQNTASIKKFQSTEHAIAYMVEKYGVICFKEDFMAERKQRILTIHVAPIGYDDIMIYNPEYKIRWYEKLGVIANTLYRMAKSKTTREYITAAFRKAYVKIDDHEIVDEFEKHCLCD
jgi:hypothetical protein